MSGVNVMPFGAPGDEAPRPALYMRDGSVEEVEARLPAALQLLLSEPKLPDLFATPQRHLRVEAALGWEDWLRSATYQDHFRFMHSARQFVLGFVDRAGVPPKPTRRSTPASRHSCSLAATRPNARSRRSRRCPIGHARSIRFWTRSRWLFRPRRY
jgi:hypothetical protein